MELDGLKSDPALEHERGEQLAVPTSILVRRLAEIQKRTQSKALERQIEQIRKGRFSLGSLNNELMDIYRATACGEAYSLIYELNYRSFFLIIFHRIRYYSHLLDPSDVLQDVFLSIFRYPHRFRNDKENAFRNWSYSIIRNTILKHVKAGAALGISSDLITEVIEDKSTYSPLSSVAHDEHVRELKRAYLLYLVIYAYVFNRSLSRRAKQALLYVEVEGKRYREASALLGIKLENFKMVVCRARKKIQRRMKQILGHAGR